MQLSFPKIPMTFLTNRLLVVAIHNQIRPSGLDFTYAILAAKIKPDSPHARKKVMAMADNTTVPSTPMI